LNKVIEEVGGTIVYAPS